MRIEANREALLRAVQVAAMAISPRPLKEILRSVLLRRLPGMGVWLHVIGTDLEMQSRAMIRVNTNEVGDLCVQADTLIGALRSSTADEASIVVDGSTATLTMGGTVYDLPIGDPAEFPSADTLAEVTTDETRLAEVPADRMAWLVRRVEYAVGESGKYAVDSLLLDADGTHLRAVATDTRRLAVARLPSPCRFTALVPERAVKMISRLAGECSDNVYLNCRANDVIFRGRAGEMTVELLTRQREGRYPPWREIFPKKSSAKIGVDYAAFIAAAQQVAVVTDAESQRCTLTFCDNLLMIEVKTTRGKAAARVPLASPVSPAMAINVDVKYLIEAARAIGESFEFWITDPNRPVLLRSTEDNTHLLMPMA